MSKSSDPQRMLINELAAATGASARSLRHYETLGLLSPERGENKYRRYPEAAIDRVKAIRYLLASGLSMPTIAKILPAMMYQHCQLRDPEVRLAIESEIIRINAQRDVLDRSHGILTSALSRGELRRTERQAEDQEHN